MNQGFNSLSSTLTAHKVQTTKGFSGYLKKTHVKAKPDLGGLGSGQNLYRSHFDSILTCLTTAVFIDLTGDGPVPTGSPFKAPQILSSETCPAPSVLIRGCGLGQLPLAHRETC